MTRRARWWIAILAVAQTIYAWFWLFKAGLAHAYASFPESASYRAAQPLLWVVMLATMVAVWSLITDRWVRSTIAIWCVLLAGFIVLLSDGGRMWLQLSLLVGMVAWVMKDSVLNSAHA